MQQSIYDHYLTILRTMQKDLPQWESRFKAIASDYLAGDLTPYGRAIIICGARILSVMRTLAQGKGPVHIIDVIDQIRDEFESYHLSNSAYFFTSKLVADLTDIEIDIDIDAIGSQFDDYHYFDSDEGKAKDTRPGASKLKYFRNKLLDFSKNNPLVNFKRSERGCVNISYPANEELVSLLLAKEKIYFQHWERLSAVHIAECGKCGMQFFKKYTPSDARLSVECPTCDHKKRTKQGKTIREEPIVLTGNKISVVCDACGHSVRTDFPIADMPTCKKCGALMKVPSYPVIPIKNVKSSVKNFCIASLNDEVSRKATANLASRAHTLEINFGLHSLYLACGFLRWTSVAGIEYTSPLLLCKVNISLDKSKNLHYMQLDDADTDPISVNYTLQKMLDRYARDISIRLPDYRQEQSYADYMMELKLQLKQYPVCEQWEVLHSSGVGLFHYQKLQLERDIMENFDEYLAHPIIKKACDADDGQGFVQSFSNSGEPVRVLDADGSQERVIEYAVQGKSFILQGPPGTGKSQTITNIISGLLSLGKTVLFVTEKSSARSIIWDNLSRCEAGDGYHLTDFVFNPDQVSGKKKSKTKLGKEAFKSFYNERYTDVVTYASARRAIGTADYTEKELVDFYDKINQPQGKSPYSIRELIDLWSQYCDAPNVDCFRIGRGNIMACNPAKSVDLISKYYGFTETFGLDYKKHPLFGYRERDITLPSLPSIESLRDALTAIKELCTECEQLYGVRFSSRFQNHMTTVSALALWSPFPKRIAECIARNNSRKKLDDWILYLTEERAYAMSRKAQYAHVLEMEVNYADRVTDTFYRTDYGDPESRLNEFDGFFSRMSKDYKEFRSLIKNAFTEYAHQKKIDWETCQLLASELQQILYYRKVHQEYTEKQLQDMTHSFADRVCVGEETDWDAIISDIDTALSILQATSVAFFNRFVTCMHQGIQYSVWHSRYSYLLSALKNALEKASENEKALSGVLDFSSLSTDETLEKTQTILCYHNVLQDWVRLSALLEEMSKEPNALSRLNTLIENGIDNASDAERALYRSYYHHMIYGTIASHAKKLTYFSREDHEKKIADYCRDDLANIANGPFVLYEKLIAEKNAGLNAYRAKGGSAKLLHKKGETIKKMIKDHWEDIRRITPCFMMSPLSVSQYLDISLKFDVVIFDEASQIFMEDSLASIVRGNQIIISGDKQQLPPSDFFKANNVLDDENEDYDDEIEAEGRSILEIMGKTNMETVSLQWHYRSRDESLIHFSNINFYNGKLTTFPSAKKLEERGVIYDYVADGCYLSGKKNINPTEADRVVELLWQEICNDERSHDTIGVVAFNLSQVYEIEERWNKWIASNATVAAKVREWEAMEEHQDAPIIFCNLDTIQGDERDTMIISTTYSKNADGNFDLRYLGPVRKESGKKRLNVAITRARKRMLIVSSMKSQDLQTALRKSSGLCNEGAETLADFLAYAEGGKEAARMGSALTSSGNRLTESICKALDENGIAYDLNIGLSSCKIDIGIKVSPDSSDYVLGIITDMQNISTQSVREYARLRDSVMTERYSWNLYHVWMLSWFMNHEKEKALLLETVINAIYVATTA